MKPMRRWGSSSRNTRYPATPRARKCTTGAVALELKGLKPEAISHYSKVAQWEFNYGDIQARLKNLRSSNNGGGPT